MTDYTVYSDTDLWSLAAKGDASAEEELIERSRYRMTLPYPSYTLIKRLLEETDATIASEDFAIDITISGLVPSLHVDKLRSGVEDIGQGRILLTLST